MDISGINHTLTQIIYDYNDNINYYNRNMRDLIHVYERTVNNTLSRSNDAGNIYISRSNSSIPSRPDISNNHIRNVTNPPIWNLFNSYSLNNPIGTMRFQNTFEDVIIHPSREQILRATEIIHWDISFTQLTCPISLERFEPQQSVCRICYCGHMYNNDSLMRWFETNVRCPVCRYDIREYDSSGPFSSTTDVSSSNSIYEPVTIRPIVSESDSETSNYDDLPDLIEDSNIIYQTTLIRNYNNENYTNNNNTNIRSNLSNIFRAFLTDELATQLPLVNNSVNDIFSNLNIPIEFDISYTNLSTNPYNS